MRNLYSLSCSTVSFFAFSHHLTAQQNNVWIFGEHAGIEFGTGTPLPFYNPEVDMLEGTAVASEYKGKTLFYNDGMSVFFQPNR